MRDLNVNVQSADLDLTHKFPWKWFLSDILAKEKTRGTVFSCFSCGGDRVWVTSSPDMTLSATARLILE